MAEPVTCSVISAVPVPFTATGELNLDTFTATLRAIDSHVEGALIAGTTGEFPALEDVERVELFQAAADTLGAARVIAHLGHASTRQVLRLADATAALGISRFALLSPYYLPTDDDGVVTFFATLCRAHPAAQVYAYLFPERTGMEVSAQTLGRVLALPGMTGVKLSGAATHKLTDYAAVRAQGQELYSGNDATLPEVVAAGGTGVVSGVSSAFPETFARLARAIRAGANSEIAAAQEAVADVVTLAGPSVTRLKTALAYRSGAPWASRMALPAVPADIEYKIAAATARYG